MTTLEALWWRREEPAWLRAALTPLALASLAYRAGAFAHRWRALPVRVDVPVISVGNLAVGGAGKTPITLALARRLLHRGCRPAVLSRGYGGRAGSGCTLVAADTPAEVAGDEPVLLARRCPELLVLAGARRVQLAREALRRGADALLLDDGLQHHGLARDLDVVAVDASNPLGNGRLLPRGPLRETPRALERIGPSGLLWLTRCDLAAPGDPQLRAFVERARALGLRGPIESAFAPAPPLEFRGRKIFLFAGIARPASFEAIARGLGAQVGGRRWFVDHHRFSARDLRRLRRDAQSCGAEMLATTEKDLVRLPPEALSAAPPIVAIPVELRILHGEDALDAALDAVLA